MFIVRCACVDRRFLPIEVRSRLFSPFMITLTQHFTLGGGHSNTSGPEEPTSGSSSPPLASQWMCASSIEHAGSLAETKCPILLARATNGGILLDISWNGPKRPCKENKTSVLCESSGNTCARVCSGYLRLRPVLLAAAGWWRQRFSYIKRGG